MRSSVGGAKPCVDKVVLYDLVIPGQKRLGPSLSQCDSITIRQVVILSYTELELH